MIILRPDFFETYNLLNSNFISLFNFFDMKNKILICVMFICISVQGQNTVLNESEFDKMNWFSDAKLGIFIHWGIYSVKGKKLRAPLH